MKCPGCDIHQTVALDIVRRSMSTPIHEFERYMCCKDCSEVRRYPYKRSHLVAFPKHQDFSERSAVVLVAGREMKITPVQDHAIVARMALIFGGDTFDRLFRGIRFDEVDGMSVCLCRGTNEPLA